MNVGVCKVSLRIPENMSLKGKRQVIKSITSKIRNKFNVAVAEVGKNDAWQASTIGVACLSNSKRHTNEVLSRAVNFIEAGGFAIELLDYEIEIIDI